MMRMQPTRERFIVEAMGVQYIHCSDNYIFTKRGMWSEGEYFYRMFKWGQSSKWWGHLKEELIGEEGDGTFGPLLWPIDESYIDAEMLATAIYTFLSLKGTEWVEKYS